MIKCGEQCKTWVIPLWQNKRFFIHSYFSEDQEEAAEFLQLQDQEANVEPCITQKLSEITGELNYKPLKYSRLPVTRTLYNSNLPLTRSNFQFPSDHFLYNFTLDNSNSR